MIKINRLKHFSSFLVIPSMIVVPLSISDKTFEAKATSFTQTCEVTAIFQPGVGWIPGSEQIECETQFTNSSDGSDYVNNYNSACGSGPCEEAPEDVEDTTDLECIAEQFQETAKDSMAQQVANEISSMDSSQEHGTFIVEHNGQLIALEIVSGDENNLPMNQLYQQMNELGISDTQIVAFIHSHPPSTNSNPTSAAAENLVNGFPSDNDYIAFESFAQNAIAFGANEAEWRSNFSGYIIGPDGTVREYEEFSQPADQVFSEESGNPIPAPGDPGYAELQNKLSHAEEDANNSCGDI